MLAMMLYELIEQSMGIDAHATAMLIVVSQHHSDAHISLSERAVGVKHLPIGRQGHGAKSFRKARRVRGKSRRAVGVEAHGAVQIVHLAQLAAIVRQRALFLLEYLIDSDEAVWKQWRPYFIREALKMKRRLAGGLEQDPAGRIVIRMLFEKTRHVHQLRSFALENLPQTLAYVSITFESPVFNVEERNLPHTEGLKRQTCL